MDLPINKPQDVRVKKYKKGWAVELKYDGQWRNLHALMEDFPDTYYFESEDIANKIADKIKSTK